MKTNYHTHHELCGHAMGIVDDYAKEAIKQKFEVLGISDHVPNSRVDDYGVRMRTKDFQPYLDEIEEAKEKYSSKLTILKGIEAEYFYDHEEYYEFLKKNLDYIILGQHYISHTKTLNDLQSSFALKTDQDIKIYANYVVEGMESGYFDILAHPDLYMCGYGNWNTVAIDVAHKICKVAETTNTVLEFNANGFRRGRHNTPQGYVQRYPRTEFWEIVKQYNIKTILSSDCHKPEFLYDDTIKEAEEVYLKLGLQKIEKINLK